MNHTLRLTVRAPRGFTMIEMLVAVALVIIILAVAVPSFGDMISRQRVRSINAELMTDLQYARSEAIQRSKKIVIRFGSNTTLTCYSVYTLVPAGDCYCNAVPPRCTGTAVALKTQIVPKSSTVSLTASSAQAAVFEIDPARGALVQGDAFVDVVSSRSGKLRTTAHPTGFVEVCSPDGSITGVKNEC